MVFVFGRGPIFQVVILELGTVNVWISGFFFMGMGDADVVAGRGNLLVLFVRL